MISLSSATLPRSRCKIRSATRHAPACQNPSGRARARGLLPRRNGRRRRRGGLRSNRFRHRGSRGRAGTGDKGKSAKSRKSRNRPAWPAPGRQNTDRDIFAIWDRGRYVCARRFLSLSSCQETEVDDETMSETLAAPSPRVRGEGGVRGRRRCLSVAGDR
jgi:hypothetical protein